MDKSSISLGPPGMVDFGFRSRLRRGFDFGKLVPLFAILGCIVVLRFQKSLYFGRSALGVSGTCEYRPAAQLHLPRHPTFSMWRTKRDTDVLLIEFMKSVGWTQHVGLSREKALLQTNFAIAGKTLPSIPRGRSGTVLLNGVYGMEHIGGGKHVELAAREKYAASLGCEFESLYLQPPTYDLSSRMSCLKFFADTKPDDEKAKINFTAADWFLKPVNGGGGKGIKIFRTRNDYRALKRSFGECGEGTTRMKRFVIQQSVPNPLLIQGRRFDIRSYILIASSKPLVVLFRSGYVRRAMHSKEQAIKRNAPGSFYKTNTHVARNQPSYGDGSDHMWTMEQLDKFLHESGKTDSPSWSKDRFTEKAESMARFIVNAARKKIKRVEGTFALLAMDIMVDDALELYLIEANTTPGMTSRTNSHIERYFTDLARSMMRVVLGFHTRPLNLPLRKGTFAHGFHVLFNEGEDKACNQVLPPAVSSSCDSIADSF